MQINDMSSVQEVFNQLPTEQLREILDKELHSDSVNADAIRLIMGVLRERNKKIPVDITPELEEAWEKYQSSSDKIWEESKRNRRIKSRIVKMISAAAVLVVLLVPIVPQEAGAESLWDALIRWTSDIVEFFGPKDNEGRIEEYVFKTDNPGLQQVYDAVVELGVTEPVVPMWLPEGAELVESKVVSYPAKTRLHTRFEYENKPIVFYVDVYNTDVSHTYQKDETEVEVYEYGGVKHFIMRNNDLTSVIWTRKNQECLLSLDCQENVIFKIIDSIYNMGVD